MFGSWRGRLPRIGRWPRLALAGVCLLLAAGSALAARGKAEAARSGTAVVVATRDLPAGHVLARHDVTVARWPAALRPDGVRPHLDGVVGRRLSGPVTAREAITKARLLGRDATTGLADGYTAVPVIVADPRLGDLIHAGDRVDLLASGSSGGAFPGTISRARVDAGTTVAAAVRVLSVLAIRAGDGLDAGSGTELVVATDQVTAERIVRLAGSQPLSAVGIPP